MKISLFFPGNSELAEGELPGNLRSGGIIYLVQTLPTNIFPFQESLSNSTRVLSWIILKLVKKERFLKHVIMLLSVIAYILTEAIFKGKAKKNAPNCSTCKAN